MDYAIMSRVYDLPEGEEHTDTGFLIYVAFCLVFSILLTAFYAGIFFLRRWMHLTTESVELRVKAAELKQAVTQAELNSLKTQIDPHFVFNNFSVLTELILEDQEVSVKFVESLSRVYRYILTNLDHNQLSVEEELKFLDAYMFLIKVRHGDNVLLKVDVKSNARKMQIPPATLQVLVENAIKHNVATAESPLFIYIYDTGDALVVSNKINRVRHFVQSTKVGLSNIESRYRLLYQRAPLIIDGPRFFQVTLPLSSK